MLAVCERVIAYQMCVVPLLYYPVFFTFTGFLQGLDAKGTFQRAKGNFLPSSSCIVQSARTAPAPPTFRRLARGDDSLMAVVTCVSAIVI
jgi:hypothetical protein